LAKYPRILTSQSNVKDGAETEKNCDQTEVYNEEEVWRPEAPDNLDDMINRMFDVIAKITAMLRF